MKYENSKISSGISMFRYKNFLVFVNPKGRIILNMSNESEKLRYSLNSKSLCITQKNDLQSKVLQALSGLKNLYDKKLSLIGIGFRAWSYFDKDKNCQILSIRVGFSKDILIIIPKDIVVFCLRPTLVLLRGLNKELVGLFGSRIKAVRQPDSYKGKGVRYENEAVSTKPGKQK